MTSATPKALTAFFVKLPISPVVELRLIEEPYYIAGSAENIIRAVGLPVAPVDVTRAALDVVVWEGRDFQSGYELGFSRDRDKDFLDDPPSSGEVAWLPLVRKSEADKLAAENAVLRAALEKIRRIREKGKPDYQQQEEVPREVLWWSIIECIRTAEETLKGLGYE